MAKKKTNKKVTKKYKVKKPPKQFVGMRLEPWTMEFIDNVVTHGLLKYSGKTHKATMRTFIEALINQFIYHNLEDKVVIPQVMFFEMGHKRLCELWLKFHRAAIEEGKPGTYPGYKRFFHDKLQKYVAVYGPEDTKKT